MPSGKTYKCPGMGQQPTEIWAQPIIYPFKVAGVSGVAGIPGRGKCPECKRIVGISIRKGKVLRHGLRT